MFISTKAQSFSIDLIIGFLIFIVAIVLYYQIITNLSDDDDAVFSDISFQAKRISSELMSGGYPENWHSEGIKRIGITDNGAVNETKLAAFSGLGYTESTEHFALMYDFYVFFMHQNSSIMPINSTLEGIGKPGVNHSNLIEAESPKKAVSISRIVIRNNRIVRMVIYLWQ